MSDDIRGVVGASMEDLDEEMLETFIQKYTLDKPNFSKYDRTKILLNAGVLTKVEDKVFPTVAGIMVFGIYPQKYFPQWFVVAMAVPGYEIAELGKVGERFIDNRRIEGNIATMYHETIKFLTKNMKFGMRLDPQNGVERGFARFSI